MMKKKFNILPKLNLKIQGKKLIIIFKKYKESLESTDTSSIRNCSLAHENNEGAQYDSEGNPIPSTSHSSSYYKGSSKEGN